jgi:glycosyltransferase involved in cell wall biosynthesis
VKILHINTSDRGGAAIACIRLHVALLNRGYDSTLLLKSKKRNVINSFSFKHDGFYNRIISRYRLLVFDLKNIKSKIFLNNRPSGLEYFSFPYSAFDITKTALYENADIIHLHWVSNYLDWKSFFHKNKKPVVWTLHDQNPYLGGDHYFQKYLGIDESGNPILRKKNGFEIFEENKLLEFKKKCLKDVKNLSIVGNSIWNTLQSQNSALLSRFEHYQIDYCFPKEIFKLLDKKACRQILNMETDTIAILFVADQIENQRKGLQYLIKAFESLSDLGILDNNQLKLYCIGKFDSIENYRYLNVLGEINDDRVMAIAYNASDVFVIPSLEEALGQVMVESLMCGTPVIGFPTGGIVENLNSLNGIICDDISVDSLVKSIIHFLEIRNKFDRLTISSTAMLKFDNDRQVDKYVSLYNGMLNVNSL